MDGVCGCLVKLSANVGQIRSNEECRVWTHFQFSCSTYELNISLGNGRFPTFDSN